MSTESLSRLRWSCRRGMLELDVLLGHFLEEAYSDLTSEHQVLFVKLLECNDQDLFDWLTAKKPAAEKDIAFMVEKIRHHAKNRH